MLLTALLCLSLNIYYEAGNEPTTAQMAVGFVTMNRADYQQERVCEVVFAPKQFSWTNHIDRVHKPIGRSWVNSQEVAKKILSLKDSRKYDITKGATHYFANYIDPPKWASNMEYKGQYGVHLFYKEVR